VPLGPDVTLQSSALFACENCGSKMSIDWWYGENEIHQKLFSAPLDDLGALRPHGKPAIGCVWELGVVDFERRAWLEHVLANAAGPDVPAYLAARYHDRF